MRNLLAGLAFALALSTAPLRGEVPKLSPEKLESRATHIVIGKVTAVYSKEHRTANRVNMDLVAEIAVHAVEKGPSLQAGDVVYARFWKTKWIGEGRPDPGSSGHTGVSENQLVRAHLTRKDGVLNVLLPNGFQEVADHEVQDRPLDSTPSQDLTSVQGKWKRFVETDDGVFTIVKEHLGNKTTLTIFDPKENVVSAKKSEFRLEETGKVRVFTFYNNEFTAGPLKGQTDEGPDSYIYRVVGDSFIEMRGLLLDDTEEPYAFTWERVRE